MRTAGSDAFSSRGYVRLEGFYPKARMRSIKRTLHDQLERLHAGRGLPASIRALPVFQQIGALSKRVNVARLHASLVTQELHDTVADLAGRRPVRVQETQLLLSPPMQGAWTLRGLNWHVDIAADVQGPVPGVQAFFLIDDVAPHGGATLALAGSHRRDIDGSALRRTLRTSVGLELALGEMGIELVEMSGRAGDVFLMDMRVLHTPSINAAKTLRMMATARCFLSA